MVLSKSEKQLYKYINLSLKNSTSTIGLRDEHGNGMIDDLAVAEAFAHHFSSVFTRELDSLPEMPNHARVASAITSVQFTPQKVADATKSLKNDSSPGPDGIPAVFLKNCSEGLGLPLSRVMNDSLRMGKVPDIWKESIVIPIYKKGDRFLPENYRPISLTCNSCKLMEKIVARELTSFLMSNHVLPNGQHGFLPGRSTVTNLLQCLNMWTDQFDNGTPTDVIYLDFEKAFDKVPFNRLLLKLEHYGVRGCLLLWIRDFLVKRRYRVRVNGSLSGQHCVGSGVPQGSVLGPLLFLVYISDLAADIKTNIVFFADDTKFFGNPLQQYDELRHDLAAIERWTETWMLPLSGQKCCVLYIGAANPRHQYQLNNQQLTGVNKQRDLGVMVASDLKWEIHINMLVKRCNSMLYFIRKAFKNMSCEMLRRLLRSYIRPRLEYASVVWSPYFVKDIEMLERVQRRATKILPDLRDQPYEFRMQRLGLTTLRERRLRGDLIETFKILRVYYTVPLNIFHLNNNSQLRGHIYKLEKERTSTNVRRNFIVNRVVYQWNSLSDDTVMAESVNAFKNKVDNETQGSQDVLVHYPR